MRISALVLLAVSTSCLSRPRDADAQTLRDTTIVLGDRPTIVAFLYERADLVAMYPTLHDSSQALFRRALQGAGPRLAEKGIDLYGFFDRYRLEDLRPLSDFPYTFFTFGSTVKLRWRARDWFLPIPIGGEGHYIWSPGGPAFLCRGSSEGDLVYTASLYVMLLRTGRVDDLAKCTRAPAG